MKQPIESIAQELEALAEELWALDGGPNVIQHAHELLVRKAKRFRRMNPPARYPRMVRDHEDPWHDRPWNIASLSSHELKSLREKRPGKGLL